MKFTNLIFHGATRKVAIMFDLLIGLAFVAMILGPAVLASVQSTRTSRLD